MAESYSVLYGKYQRALVSIRELEQERDFYDQQLDELKQSYTMIEKNTKTLCETILKKEREKKDEKTWFRMSLIDLIATAQTSLENYFPSVEKEFRLFMDRYTARQKKITELEEKIEKMETEHKKELMEARIQAAADDENKEDTDKTDEIDNSPENEIDLDSLIPEKTSVIVEEKDHMEDIIADSVAIMYNDGHVRDITGPKVFNDKKAQKIIDKKVSERSKELCDNINKETLKTAESLNENQKVVLQAFGETGLSEFKELLLEASAKLPGLPNETTSRRALYFLKNTGFVDVTKLSLPGNANMMLYKLTETGRDAFRYLFKKDPVESEMSSIIRNHTSLEHGYGIKKAAQTIEKMDFIQKTESKVYYMTRAKNFTIQTGADTKYIPDIVIVTHDKNEEKTMYIEYETGKCTDIDFFKKCNKIAGIQNPIYIIVPDKDAKDRTEDKIKNWKEYLKENTSVYPRKGPVRIYLSTLLELKEEDTSKGLQWEKGSKYRIMPPAEVD